MPEQFGYWGKILRVDLTREEVRASSFSAAFARKYIGGKGFAARILYDELPPKIDALSPDNEVVLAAGPFTGTAVPGGGGRSTIAAKSPLTGIFVDSNIGGSWGAQLRMAGFDAVVVRGRSERMSCLIIEDKSGKIVPSEHLRGKETEETQRLLSEDLGDRVSTVCIGPAGEKLVRFACVVSELGRNAGRGGMGAVFGSKNLKAVSVKGSLRVPLYDENVLRKRTVELSGKMTAFDLGTPMSVASANATSSLATRNFQTGFFDQAENITGEVLRQNYVYQHKTCFSCPKHCRLMTKLTDDSGTTVSEGPEYETIGLLGSNCGIGNLPSIIRANALCDQLGLDTISTGSAIAFTMECFEKGIIDRTATMDLSPTFGNEQALMELIRLIASRTGIGDVLAEGTLRASRALGKRSEQFAMQVKGMEIPAWEPRGLRGRGLMYALNDSGANHNKGWVVGQDPPNASALDKVPGFIRSQNEDAVRDSLGMCTFPIIYDGVGIETQVQLLNVITGWEMPPSECAEAGQRIINLARLFAVREGICRVDDTLPTRFFEEATKGGPADGCKAFITKTDFEACLDRYYELRGWDDNGVPTTSTLEKLGLSTTTEH